MEHDDKARRAVIRLLRQGLVTPGQAARLAGVSRQLVNYWLDGWDWQKVHDARLARLWRSEIRRDR